MFKFYVIAILAILGFSTYYNWFKDTPERFCDPVNWMIMGVVGIIYFLVIRGVRNE